MTLILFKIKHSSLMIIFLDSWTTELVEAFRICVARIIVWLLSTRILYKERRTRDRSIPNFSDPLLIQITPKSVSSLYKVRIFKTTPQNFSTNTQQIRIAADDWWLDVIIIYCILYAMQFSLSKSTNTDVLTFYHWFSVLVLLPRVGDIQNQTTTNYNYSCGCL